MSDNMAEKMKYVEMISSMAIDCQMGGISYPTFLGNLKAALRTMDKMDCPACQAGLRPGCQSMAESRRRDMEERPSIDPRTGPGPDYVPSQMVLDYLANCWKLHDMEADPGTLPVHLYDLRAELRRQWTLMYSDDRKYVEGLS